MWNRTTKQILSTITINLFLMLTLSPMSAGAFPNNAARGPSPLAPYEISVWTEAEAKTWEIPRNEEVEEGVPVIDGDLVYQSMGDLFSQEDIEVAPDGNSILFAASLSACCGDLAIWWSMRPFESTDQIHGQTQVSWSTTVVSSRS